MANHDYSIANQSFPSFRTDLNNALAAIASTNSGTSAPSTTFANQLWYDSSANILYIRNEDNDANIPLLSLNQSADVASTLATAIDILDASGTNTAGTDLTIRAGASTGNASGGKIILQTADGGSSGSSVNSHATAVTILDDGKTGILETAPTVPLEVKGAQAFASSASNLLTSTTKAAAKIRGSNDASAALFFGSLTGDAEQYIQSCNGAGDGADDICLNPFGGNVGIGVTTANTYSGFTTVTIGGSGNADLDFERNGTVIGSIFTETSQDDFDIQAANDLVFQSGGSNDRMRIRGTEGNVGIGGAGGATVKLFVQDTSATAYTLYAQNSSGSYNGGIFVAQSQRAANSAFTLMQGFASTDLEFNFRGDGNAFADGSFTGGGADYAEMFEWDDGNSDNEDRRGYSVVLTNGNKIRKATSDDTAADIIGVVSANPTVLGDSAWNMWDEKYLKDDFGGYVLESYTITEWTEPAVYEDVQIEAVLDEEGNEIQKARTEQRKVSDKVEHSYETDKIPSDLTVPKDAVVSDKDDNGNEYKRRKLNSDYDDTKTYICREDRKEWSAIGMMGKLRMRSGQPTGDRWIKMRDVASGVEEWLVR